MFSLCVFLKLNIGHRLVLHVSVLDFESVECCGSETTIFVTNKSIKLCCQIQPVIILCVHLCKAHCHFSNH